MTRRDTNAGAHAFLKSVLPAPVGLLGKAVHLAVAHSGFVLLLLVGLIYLLSPELQPAGAAVRKWLLAYTCYIVAAEVLRRVAFDHYETPAGRMVRIQVTALLASWLQLIGGGAQSPYWFVFMHPMYATGLYFSSRVMWLVFAEISCLYFVSSLNFVRGVTRNGVGSLLADLGMLLVSTLVLRYLVRSVSRHLEAEQEITRLHTHERMSQQLSVLNQIGQRISSSAVVGTAGILKLVHQQTGRLMDTSNLYIALYDKESDTVSFGLAFEDGQPVKLGEREWEVRKAGNGLTEYVIRSREPQLVSRNVPDWLEENGVQRIGRDAKSWLGVPMIAGEQVLGVIAVQSYEAEDVYDESHRDVLQTIASQAAIAVVNARLFQERKARLEELEALHNSFRALAYRAIGLTSESTELALSAKALGLVSDLLEADAALYVCSRDNPNVMELRRCSPDEFDTRLRPICQEQESPLQDEWRAASYPALLTDARSRDQRLEGLVLVQRVGTPEQPAPPFSDNDRSMLSFMASTIGHALRILRRSWANRL